MIPSANQSEAMEYKAKTITCMECRRPFTFSAEERATQEDLGSPTSPTSAKVVPKLTAADLAPSGRSHLPIHANNGETIYHHPSQAIRRAMRCNDCEH